MEATSPTTVHQSSDPGFQQPGRSRTKSRQGCWTCRKRKIKCDERKPQCMRCEASKRICEYAPTSQRLQTPRRMVGATPLTQAMVPIYGSAEETRYLDSYLRLCGPWFSSYCSDSYFFHDLIPQASWHYPALRHALVSVAMQAESARLPVSYFDQRKAQWYHQRALHDIAADRSAGLEFVLLTSILFWYYESIAGRSEAAAIHLKAALRIIYERRTTKTLTANDTVTNSIEPHILYGLLMSAATFQISTSESIEPLDPQVTQEIRSRLASPSYRFSTKANVRAELGLAIMALPHAVVRHTMTDTGVPDDSVPTFQELRSYLERFYRAFKGAKDFTPQEQTLLECHYICVSITLTEFEFGRDPSKVTNTSRDSRWDDVLDMLDSLNLSTMEQAPFANDLQLPVIPLLTSTAHIAHNQATVQRALNMLRSLNRFEGIWHSRVAADLFYTMRDFHKELLATGTSPSNNSSPR